MPPAHATRLEPDRIQVGDRVRLSMGVYDAVGVVVEDRGRIGVGGRQLLRVQVAVEPGVEPIEIEVPASDVRLLPRSRR